MREELYNKLHTALYHISPLASDRDAIIEQMGEVIWLETLEKSLSLLPEDKRQNAVALLNEGNVEGAVDIFTATDIDIEKIITETAIEVMKDVEQVK